MFILSYSELVWTDVWSLCFKFFSGIRLVWRLLLYFLRASDTRSWIMLATEYSHTRTIFMPSTFSTTLIETPADSPERVISSNNAYFDAQLSIMSPHKLVTKDTREPGRQRRKLPSLRKHDADTEDSAVARGAGTSRSAHDESPRVRIKSGSLPHRNEEKLKKIQMIYSSQIPPVRDGYQHQLLKKILRRGGRYL